MVKKECSVEDLKPSQIKDLFFEAINDKANLKDVNLKTKYGYLYYVGGILNKLIDNDHYIANQELNVWEKVI